MGDGIHLTDFHAAVTDYLRDNVEWLQHVDYYPEIKTEVPAPCAFFSVADWELAGEQSMNGQLSVVLNCELLVVFGIAETSYQLDVRNAAMALCLKIRDNRWGLPVDPAVLSSAAPDAFNPELDSYAVWRIEWRQQIDVGVDQFAGAGVLPSKVLVGYSPDTGLGNEDKYHDVTGGSALPSV